MPAINFAKRTLFADEKVSIGMRAATLISDGDSVLLDSGNTTLQVARHINPKDSLVVEAREALARSGVEVIIV